VRDCLILGEKKSHGGGEVCSKNLHYFDMRGRTTSKISDRFV